MNNKKVVAVIPARGGSKGIPRKNIKILDGYPLIAYTIVSALNCKLLSSVIVSTEDEEIIKVSKEYGALVPFVRPKELSTDKALAIPTIQHAVSEMERNNNCKYDYIVMLQPTCPFTTSTDIDNCIQKLINTNADSVISVVDVGAYHPVRMKEIIDDELVDYNEEEIENMPRQMLPPVYIRSGDIYAVKRDILMIKNSFKGRISRPYIIPSDRAINIDNENDWMLAEATIKRFGNPLTKISINSKSPDLASLPDLVSLYESVYKDDYKKFFSRFKDGKDTSETHDLLLSLIDWDGKRVLDFGCGPGRTAKILAEKGAIIDGIDYSEHAIKLAKQQKIQNASFILGSFEQINLQYDIIISLGTIEHIKDPLSAVKIFYEHLSKDGVLILTCPNWINIRGYILITLYYLFNLRITLTDLHYITPHDINYWASAANMYVHKQLTFDHSKGIGELMIHDLRERLPKIFKETNYIPEEGIKKMISWLEKIKSLNKENHYSGSMALYVLKKR